MKPLPIHARRAASFTATYWAIRIILILNSGIAISTFGLWIIAAAQGLLWRADFSAYYTGWAMVRDGLGAQLYDFDLQSSYQQQILGGRSFADGLLSFINPPHTALIFLPLSWLSLSTAYAVWAAFQVSLLIWLLYRFWHFGKHWSLQERQMMTVTILAFNPLLQTLLKGNFSLILLVCLTEFCLALRSNKQIKAGLWLVIGSLKPQTLVLPGISLLGARQWKTVATSVGGMSIIIIIIDLLWGWHVWIDFVMTLVEIGQISEQQYGIAAAAMYNFKSLLTILLGNQAGDSIAIMSVVALIASMGFTLWQWSRATTVLQAPFNLHFALTILLSLFTSLHLFPHDTLSAILPAVLFYDHIRQQPNQRWRLGGFLLICPLLFLISYFTIPGKWGNLPPILTLLALTIWIAHTIWKAGYAQKTP